MSVNDYCEYCNKASGICPHGLLAHGDTHLRELKFLSLRHYCANNLTATL